MADEPEDPPPPAAEEEETEAAGSEVRAAFRARRELFWLNKYISKLLRKDGL